jgi:lysophospholipase L1-like esterase
MKRLGGTVVVCLGIAAVAIAPRDARGGSLLKLSNIGDSISQAFAVDATLGDHPTESWVQGTDPMVNSVYSRFLAQNMKFVQEPQSVSGAELVGGNDSFPAQAQRVCAQTTKADHVEILLGGNDVCNRAASGSADATANMYSVDTWVQTLRAGLDQLAECLPDGAVVQIMSVPRVDFLFDAGTAKSSWCNQVVWPLASVCRIVTAETDPARRAQVGARVDAYNDATLAEVKAYDSNKNGKNKRGMRFTTDWVGSIASDHANTSLGTYKFGPDEINSLDCFHPDQAGQHRLACVAWVTNPDGHGARTDCFPAP